MSLTSAELQAKKLEIVQQYAEEISAYPTDTIEEIMRELIRRDMAELRRQNPEIFAQLDAERDRPPV